MSDKPKLPIPPTPSPSHQATTSLFSKGAREYVEQIPNRVVLIDGPRLAELMIRYRVGVQIKRTYEVVEVDEDYFE